jgi:predicted component of type VI protein secretion system
MNPERLKSLLADLHRELSDAPGLDADARRLVEQVRADISRVAGTEASPADLEAGVKGRLDEAILALEARHPRLAATLGELADTLGRLGI